MPRTHRTRIALTGLLTLTVVCFVLAHLWAQQKPAPPAASAEALMGTAQYQEEVEGKPETAIATYRKVIAVPEVARTLAARAQFRIGACYERLGQAEAKKAYDAVVRQYSDQPDVVRLAQTRLAALTTSATRPGGDGPTLRRLFAGADEDAPVYGVISPDGQLVAYDAWDKNGVETIGIRNLSSGETRHLVQGPCALDNFAWSASSNQIVFDCYPKGWKQVELRMIGLTDTASRLILSTADRIDSFDVSPDGTSVFAMMGSSAATRLVAVSTKDGTVRTLRTEGGRQFGSAVRLSRDGRSIAYSLYKAGALFESDIYAIPASGGEPLPIVVSARHEELLGWTPDGRGLVYLESRIDSVGLWWVPVIDGRRAGEPQRIRTEIRGVTARYAFMTRAGALVCTTGGSASILHIAALDAERGRLASSAPADGAAATGYASVPAWSPDGRSIAFVDAMRLNSTGRRLALLIPTTGQVRQFTLPARPGGDLRWSADGRWLYYGASASQGGQSGIYRTSFQTGETAPLANGFGLGNASISRDGKRAFYVRFAPSAPAKGMVRDLESGTDRELYQTAGPASLSGFELSPDEKWIAINEWDRATPATGSIKLISANGGDATLLLRPPAGISSFTYTRWSSDSQKVHVVTRGKGHPTEFWSIPIDGSAPTKVDISPLMPQAGFSVHPDGKQVVFTSVSYEPDEVWMLENLLPKPTVVKK